MKRTGLFIFIFLLCSGVVSAQLCNGSLGDPIRKFDFGDREPCFGSNGYTTMNCTGGGSVICPPDGSYLLTSSTTACFGDTWYTVRDHTGNTNGKFMLINASFTPSDFYLDSVTGLCGNTTFEFSAWVVNMLKANSCGNAGIKPNLTFSIETNSGAVLKTYQTGDIASDNGNWKQYGTFFTLPAGVTSVVIRLTNNAAGGCGNDLGIDDITFRPCAPLVQTTIRNQASTSVTFCDENNSLAMEASSAAGFANKTLQWQVSTDNGISWVDIAGAQSPVYTRPASAPGTFRYRTVSADAANFSNAPCRVASNPITVVVKDKPAMGLKNTVGCTGQNLSLQTTNDANYTYQWRGPNSFTSSVYNPVINTIRFIDSGLYTVRIDMKDGCIANDSFYVNVLPGIRATASADTAICEGGSASLSATGGASYLWSPATGLSNPQASNPTARPGITTAYLVTVSGANGCKDSVRTNVTVFSNPLISAGPDKVLFAGGTVQLDGSISGSMSGFYWSPLTAITGAASLSPTVSPTDTITYTLNVIPGQGCPAITDDVFVFVYKSLNVPNAFSPNGDGVNDTWTVSGLNTYAESITRIYNRTGQLVFEGKAGASWDGTFKGQPVPVATYYYLIDLRTGQAPLSGWVVVLR